MCQLCEKNPVYEFTNKRKLCKNCYIHWFEKKFLYTIRKYHLLKKNEIVLIQSENNFRDAVLLNLLWFYSKQNNVKVINLPTTITPTAHPHDAQKLTLSNFFAKKIVKGKQNFLNKSNGDKINYYNLKDYKIAISNSLDVNSYEFIKLIRENSKKNDFEKFLPIYKNVIRPLFLFLDKEILLYAKLKGLKFPPTNPPTAHPYDAQKLTLSNFFAKKIVNGKENFVSKIHSGKINPLSKKNNKYQINEEKWNQFIDESEKKHPELKNALMNSYLKIFYQ